MHSRTLVLVPLACLTLCVQLSSAAIAETWGDRLGFPADKKVVILHVHEMGMCFETSDACERLLDSGSAGSATAMVPGPWFGQAAAWCDEHPQADVGVQLTLNSEWPQYRWKPVAPEALTGSLRDAEGFFWRTPLQVMVNAQSTDVMHELRAQVERAEESGWKPAHLATHLGTLFMRQDLAEAYLGLARDQWIPAVVVELTPEHVDRFRRMGFPLPMEMIQLLSDYPLPKLDDLQFAPSADSYAEKKRMLLELIGALQPGITQVAFHPATDSSALRALLPDWQQRVWEAQLLEDDEVRQALGGEEIILTNWAELMARFEGRTEAPRADAD